MAQYSVRQHDFGEPAQAQSSQLYFSIDELAERFRVERSTIERYVHRGKFGNEWFRMGTRIIIPAKGVYAFENDARTNAQQ
jgi:excisionase family DNA binding protein